MYAVAHQQLFGNLPFQRVDEHLEHALRDEGVAVDVLPQFAAVHHVVLAVAHVVGLLRVAWLHRRRVNAEVNGLSFLHLFIGLLVCCCKGTVFCRNPQVCCCKGTVFCRNPQVFCLKSTLYHLLTYVSNIADILQQRC